MDGIDFIKKFKNLPDGKKIYFASDFHLGSHTEKISKERERKIVKWLDFISADAHAVFLVGDIFDFWFEYKYTIPKGFIHFQAKLIDLQQKGIHIIFFTGNHDLWMFDYFQKELGIHVFHQPISLCVNQKKIYVGHGDGLGPGDTTYKWLKKIFTNKFFQRLFECLHPNVGVWIAKMWSKDSRDKNKEHLFREENEALFHYTKQINKKTPHDYYILGHRHKQLKMRISDKSIYYNLGEWITGSSYVSFDGEKAMMNVFED